MDCPVASINKLKYTHSMRVVENIAACQQTTFCARNLSFVRRIKTYDNRKKIVKTEYFKCSINTMYISASF